MSFDQAASIIIYVLAISSFLVLLYNTHWYIDSSSQDSLQNVCGTRYYQENTQLFSRRLSQGSSQPMLDTQSTYLTLGNRPTTHPYQESTRPRTKSEHCYPTTQCQLSPRGAAAPYSQRCRGRWSDIQAPSHHINPLYRQLHLDSSGWFSVLAF